MSTEERRGPSMPSHLTMAQTVRHLRAAGHPISSTRVWDLSRRRGPLEAETHDGTQMIPRWRIMAFLEKGGAE